ncbi:MAG TPA: bifunctional DNA-formamidopyrimidine glycosylase/DNA-(apurinic or apyrimidinic site) lyase [Acidimicrobiia bacterium]|nr:bifunctional DNA-formamidopyrimidine glycosylase/DNA-(apurinic or apyrimidinic site) lyase [Acidimicrobiia bacterium]
MPELPEVESATRRLRRAIAGKTIVRVDVFHPSLRRRLSKARLRSLAGAEVRAVERRGKHQLILLADGRVVHAHFRMTGDWHIDRVEDELPRFARAALRFEDGARVVLDDPRALSTLDLHPAGAPIELGLGPEPSDPSLTADSLRDALSKRRGPIKPALLDQRLIAGLGNIYAAEALWHARIAPAAPANTLTRQQVTSLLRAVRRVIDRATGARYTDSSVSRLAVYDREEKPCRRCRTPIERMVQAGRSTYFCPNCQRLRQRDTR